MRVLSSAIALLLLAGCGDDKPEAGLSVEACRPWVAWKAARAEGINTEAIGAKTAAICGCVVEALTAKNALSAADRAAVTTYFSVFGNPVKRDPAYGHISQDGRKALTGALSQCAKKSGFDLE